MIPELLTDWSPTPVTLPYWRATAVGELQLQRCRECRRWQHPPRAICTVCGCERGLDWQRVSGRGTVFSSTVVHRALISELRPFVPYVLALVELQEGPRLMTLLESYDADADAALASRPVQVAFRMVTPEAVLPVFRLL
jgi:uncharacterized OB-fold protein